MSDYDDKYAVRAFENISEMAEGNKAAESVFGVIAMYFNIKSIEDIEESEDTLTILSNKYDIRSRHIQLEKDWYKNSAMPMIIETDNGKKCVIPDTFGNCSYYENGNI